MCRQRKKIHLKVMAVKWKRGKSEVNDMEEKNAKDKLKKINKSLCFCRIDTCAHLALEE